MSDPRVFVVQVAQKWNGTKMVPKYDISAAEKYGRIVPLLAPNARPTQGEAVLDELARKLADFSDDDHILCIGNPALIGFAMAFATDANQGRVQVLQWMHDRYLSVKARIFDEGLDSDEGDE